MSTEEIQNATPAAPETAEQVQSVESSSPEATTEQTQEVVQQEEPQEQREEAKKEPWFQKRINEQTRKYYEAERKAQELQQRLARYEQQQYQAPEQSEPSQHVDLDTLAEQRAAQLIAERSFNEACNKVYAVGAKEFAGTFDSAVQNLQLVGVTRDFLEAVTASDAGHKILNHLGKLDNLGEAERILKLSPVQMGRELARLEARLTQPPAPTPISNAPAPIKPIGSSATGEVDPSKLSDAEWFARRNK